MTGETANPGEAAPVKRARYQRPLAAYVAIFNRSERTLKGLIAIGRDATPPELPPFDDPPRMKDWWTRRMKNRVPDDIAALALTTPPAVSTPSSPPASASPGPLFETVTNASATAPPPPAAPPSAGVGFSAALARLRAAEAGAGELYTSLLRQAGDASLDAVTRTRLAAEAEQSRRAWDELGEKLRRYEKDAEQILSASGRMWNADDVVAANDLVHLVLRESIFGLLRRVRPKLVGKPTPEQDTLWHDEVDRMLAILRDNKFTAPADVAA